MLKDQNPSAHAKMLDLMHGDVKDPGLIELSSEISNNLLSEHTGLKHISMEDMAAYQEWLLVLARKLR